MTTEELKQNPKSSDSVMNQDHPFNNPQNHAMFCESILKRVAKQAKQGVAKKKLAKQTKLSRDEILYINKKFNPSNPYKEINVNKDWFNQIVGKLFFNYPNYLEEFEAFINALEQQKEKQEILNNIR